MDNLIHIKHNDNVYLLRNETPKYGELSIYVNEDNTRVSQSKCANPDGGKYRHVKVEWMYEKEKIAFESIDWMREWTREITNYLRIETDKEE